MKVLNEEMPEKEAVFVLILNIKEAKILSEIVNIAADSNKKKKSFKKFQEELNIKLCCF